MNEADIEKAGGATKPQLDAVRGLTANNIITRRAGRVRFFGDSITVGRGNTPSVLTNWLTYAGLGPATWAMLTSTSNFTLVGNSAGAGERSDQVLARVQEALLLKDADIFVVPTCTWNDRGQGSVSYTHL